MNDLKKLETLTTMELAFGLATQEFSDVDKLRVLSIINQREKGKKGYSYPITPDELDSMDKILDHSKILTFKKGSKSETINKLLNEGKTVPQIFIEMNKGELKTTNSEIYRIKNIRDKK